MFIVLILMLAIASIFAPHWICSTVFMIFYLVFALLLLSSVFYIPDIFIKILHLLLAILIITLVMVKVSNVRMTYTLPKGAEYQLIVDEDTLSIKLMNCNILKDKNKKIPQNYASDILVDDEKVQISPGQPYVYKRSRFYQGERDSSRAFIFSTGEGSLKLFSGQNANFLKQKIEFHSYDELKKRVAVSLDNVLYLIPLADEAGLFYVVPGESVESIILEYAEVKGHVFLFIIASLVLILMIFVRFRGQ